MDADGLAQALERFARVGLVSAPTPLEPLERLSAHLGGPRIWAKREDLTGLGFGGNKLRKLEVVLADALAQGADVLVSGGVVQSNSQRQVAAAAARLGLECHLAVYHGRVAPPSRAYETSGNALLNRLYGAKLHDVPWSGDRNGAIEAIAERLRHAGRRPYVVPYGVSNPFGAVGYATVAPEIAAQCAGQGLAPTAIVHCSGSGATQAGLVIGAAAALPDVRIIGIDIDAEPERVKSDVLRYGEAAAALLGAPFDPERVEVVAGLAGPAYGVAHAETLAAVRLAARLEALLLDPVYSGKGLAGLITLIEEGRFRPGEDVIFLATGGVPALFAYEAALSDRGAWATARRPAPAAAHTVSRRA